jgi:hypothetical protein
MGALVGIVVSLRQGEHCVDIPSATSDPQDHHVIVPHSKDDRHLAAKADRAQPRVEVRTQRATLWKQGEAQAVCLQSINIRLGDTGTRGVRDPFKDVVEVGDRLV